MQTNKKPSTMNHEPCLAGRQVATLFPILAFGIIIILCIAIVASYVHTATMQGTVILPGGVTYTGK